MSELKLEDVIVKESLDHELEAWESFTASDFLSDLLEHISLIPLEQEKLRNASDVKKVLREIKRFVSNYEILLEGLLEAKGNERSTIRELGAKYLSLNRCIEVNKEVESLGINKDFLKGQSDEN